MVPSGSGLNGRRRRLHRHVRFQKLARFPGARTANVMSQIRRLSRAIQCAEELTRVNVFGHRAERT